MQILPLHICHKLLPKEMHFKVFKSTVGDDTLSELKLLNDEERLVEIAQMLSGNRCL
jgi:DNA repair protein RecN (Recombination protein N)